MTNDYFSGLLTENSLQKIAGKNIDLNLLR